MLVYLGIMLVAILLGTWYQKSKSKLITREIAFFLSFLTLFLFAGLRYKVGYDYGYTYLPGYYNIANGGNSRFEVLFVLLNKFVFYVFNNVDYLFIICSLISIGLIYLIIKKESADIGISLLMLFVTKYYFYTFSQIRQYIAIAMFIYSIRYIIERKPVKYYILMLIAFGFHKTAIIYFPMYFIKNFKLTKKKYVMIMMGAILLTPIVKLIYQVIGSKFYGAYIEENYGVGNSSIVMVVTGIFLTIVPLIFYEKLNKCDKNNILLNLQLAFWIFLVTLSDINESYRIVGMFMYSSILLIPECYSLASKKQKRIILIILCGIAVLSTYYLLNYKGSTMIPYRTIFNKE